MIKFIYCLALYGGSIYVKSAIMLSAILLAFLQVIIGEYLYCLISRERSSIFLSFGVEDKNAS
ncbi:hypothetical protein AGMMS5026_04870 [Endomicrobiia bacterium]|nr:hypothetical protein AGMMS49523_00240 [Endomicrobiia bacterium]GHT09051.1 hypothetical protein AGMMS49532_05820 [Endomicrobiia bacterium]GHT11222.1 hypothetical protein AGMMS49571_01200 [Endomicrobiia bacterium]GHT19606.1 hypothetical protein AGMMS49929_03730 [Endomicrobiia bacterium]GHT25679.1 hypothetical protein AGMMS49995_00240 [Endomicrobiia bacterium]